MNMIHLRGRNSLKYRESLCNGCGRCQEVCPHGVFRVFEIAAVLESPESCMECGACAKNCPTGAISVKAGVGCAQAILKGVLKGTAPDCGCGSSGCCSGG